MTTTRIVGAGDIVTILRTLEGRVQANELAVLRMRPIDTVDWSTFPTTPACSLPGLPVGQRADLRFGIMASAEGLHVHLFPEGHIDIHLDAANACRDVVGHLVQDTRMVEGAALGSAVALLFSLFSNQSAKTTVTLMAAGAVGGGALGGHVAARQRRIIFPLRDLLQAGW